jgi:hypothetical protein
MTRKAQEGHLEEGKDVRPTKDMKSGKPSKIAKKGYEKFKTKTKRARKAQIQKLPLNQTPSNKFNASSPT